MPRARGGSSATNGSKASAGETPTITTALGEQPVSHQSVEPARWEDLTGRLEEVIRVRGARQHSLRNVDLTIPRT
ncbi:MAG: hypothetical protein ACK5W5_06945, partial [Cyanobacteriota bacterium]